MSKPLPQMLKDLSTVDPWSIAPFDAQTVQALRNLVQPLNAAQRLWLSGFLAGSANLEAPVAGAAAPIAKDAAITILFGSQSGNCERVATQLSQALSERGIAHVCRDMLDCRKNHLQDAAKLLVIVSTHGEGDPPDRAVSLHELLHSRKAPSLKHLKYSVLALGDSSYEKFCETGRQFDARLAELGAQALHARVDCDVDFEAAARQWIDAVVADVTADQPAVASAQRTPERALASVTTAYTRKNPFQAAVLANQRLTARGSEKDVRHLEFSLEGSGMHYEPGDALGIVVRNSAANVERLLAILPYEADTLVRHESAAQPLREVLHHCDIGAVTRAFTHKYLERIGAQAAQTSSFVNLTSLVTAFPPKTLGADDFAQLLRPLAPRLYSIASSAKSTPDEVHLTVALVQFEFDGQLQYGVASHQIADMAGEAATAPVYLHRNPNFRLPSDATVPIIMIGPGTGVAPFRAFLAERDALGARGRNWLFFGGRQFRSDFLYQAEWLDYRKRGLLNRIDLAFSRDQTQKIYVQQRMREQGRQLFSWLQEGAHLYVCGDAQYMASDVHQALLDVLREHGGYSAERAAEEVLELQRARRYQRDVY
jgi:sulfite reductase (NADPH) flavoprotein alpha-component